MDKNSIIGFILMAAILFGFTFYQSKDYKKKAAEQARLDSIARVEWLAQAAKDSIAAAEATAGRPNRMRESTGSRSGRPSGENPRLPE